MRARRFEIPELRTLLQLRGALARGGMPPLDKRTPVDCARLGIFRAVEELLELLGRFAARVVAGERCRLVEKEHAREPGRLVFELVIESVESAPHRKSPVAGSGRHAGEPPDPDLAGSFACRPVPATSTRRASSVGESEGA